MNYQDDKDPHMYITVGVFILMGIFFILTLIYPAFIEAHILK